MGELQERRVCRVNTPFGDDVLLVKNMKGTESISELFCFELELGSKSSDLDFKVLLGQKVSLEIDVGDAGTRYIHGIVSRFGEMDAPGEGELGNGAFDRTTYYMQVVPWTWLLTRRQDCRIFQEKTIPDIVEEVFNSMGFADFEFKLNGSYDPLVNCVQYQETDFDFISRLLEAEGIFYFFEHTESKHTMFLTDTVENLGAHPQWEVVLYHPNAETRGEVERATAWHLDQLLQPGHYAMKDYNFMDPATDLLVGAKSSLGLDDLDKYEIFTYPGDYTNLGGEGEGKLSKGDARVRLRMEEGDARSVIVRGKSNNRKLAAGYKFNFEGHKNPDFNEEWLCTSIQHQVDIKEETALDALASGGRDARIGGNAMAVTEQRYANKFTCVWANAPFRPPLTTPRPRIPGPQTALVVGPSGEEIYVDKHGRVKVQFHWDRYGTGDENSSCWVRVSQNWAGKQWGMIFHPRIGQEVVVEFLEGNPDRPLITGRVYNGANPIPYTVPTQSGILTRSTKGGSTDNFNQIRFEDEKGSEEIQVHAEKDMNRIVENNDTENVGANQTSTIKANKTVKVSKDHAETIGADMALTVGKKREMTIGEDLAETVGGKMDLTVGKTLSETVGEARSVTVGEANTVSVGAAESYTVGKSQTVDIAKSQSLSIGKNLTVSVGAEGSVDIGKTYALSAQKITIEAKDELKIKVGSAELTFKKNGDINVKGKKIDMKASADFIIKGSKVGMN